MSWDMPGYGDAITWGPIRGPGDPRWEEPPMVKCEECAGLGELLDLDGYHELIGVFLCPCCKGVGKVELEREY
jgi:hypothetical protein